MRVERAPTAQFRAKSRQVIVTLMGLETSLPCVRGGGKSEERGFDGGTENFTASCRLSFTASAASSAIKINGSWRQGLNPFRKKGSLISNPTTNINLAEIHSTHGTNRPARAGRLFNRKFKNSSSRPSGRGLDGEFLNFHSSLGVSGDRSPEPGLAASEQRDFSGYSFGHKRVPPAAAGAMKDKRQLAAGLLSPQSALADSSPSKRRGALSLIPQTAVRWTVIPSPSHVEKRESIVI